MYYIYIHVHVAASRCTSQDRENDGSILGLKHGHTYKCTHYY